MEPTAFCRLGGTPDEITGAVQPRASQGSGGGTSAGTAPSAGSAHPQIPAWMSSGALIMQNGPVRWKDCRVPIKCELGRQPPCTGP